jgi:hypothetical protein
MATYENGMIGHIFHFQGTCGQLWQLPTGGRLTTTLSELETNGFILRTVPFGKTVRDSVYRLIDAFTLFYLRWVSSRMRCSHHRSQHEALEQDRADLVSP